MIIILSLLLVLVIGIVLMMNDRKWGTEVSEFICTAVGGVLLFIALICLPISHMGINADIAEFKATKTTVISARSRNINLENAAIQHKIIECNQWLAKAKYYNNTVFGLWVPDKVEALNPIE